MRALLLVGVAATAAIVHSTGRPANRSAREVEVVGFDYAFQHPSELPAGPTVFRFVNKGKVRHEFNIALLKQGVKPADVVALRKQGKSVTDLIEAPLGVLFANPNGRAGGDLSTNLLPGRDYTVICIFRDTANAPRHYEIGMYSFIHVRAGKASPQRRMPLDTIVGVDYAFKYPTSVSPGRRALAFDNQGKVRHEMIVALLKSGVTVDSALKIAKGGGDIDAVAGLIGLLHAPAGQKPLGMLEVDFLPGREYAIVCFFTDTAKSPPHAALGMYGSIRVAGKPRS